MNKIYVIYGEDPNCDFGGCHYSPVLGYVEGNYDDVLKYAKTLPGWITWGSGGEIKEIKIKRLNKKATTMIREAELKNKRDLLLHEISKINKELGNG